MVKKKFLWINSFLILVVCSFSFFLTVEKQVLAFSKKSVGDFEKSIQGQEFVISALENNQYGPAVAYNWKHREYLVVWENVWPGGSHDVYAQRISEDGTLLSWFFVPDGTVSTSDRLHPDVEYDPVEDRYLVVWVADVSGDLDVIGRFIPWEGPDPALHEFQISSYIDDEWKPKIAFARGQVPMEFLVVWMNSPAAGDRWIGYSRVNADGNNPFPTNYVLTQGTGDRDFPDIAYNRTNNTYLVVWDFDYGSDFDIKGIRIHGDGSAIGSEISISSYPNNEEHPTVAACAEADQFLVAWQSYQTTDYDIYARFIAGDGTVGSFVGVEATGGDDLEASAACSMNGSSYLLTWQMQYSSLTGPYGITGKLIFPNGDSEPSFAISGPFIGVTTDFQTEPAVAGGYHNFLTVWEQDRFGTTYQDIYGRFFTPYTLFLPLLTR